jgi:hypothetical protein
MENGIQYAEVTLGFDDLAPKRLSMESLYEEIKLCVEEKEFVASNIKIRPFILEPASP